MSKSGTEDANWDAAWPKQMREAEDARVQARRHVARLSTTSGTVGFALSGGGIRSATFCLGVFQSLAKAGLIRQVDYLSTVSGGGYFGAFLTRLISRGITLPGGIDEALHPACDKVTVSDHADGRPDQGRRKSSTFRTIRPLPWLLRNGNYMAPGGGSDVLTLLASALRNLLTLHLLIAANLLLLALLLRIVEQGVIALPFTAPMLASLPSFGRWLAAASGGLFGASPIFDLIPLLALLFVPSGAGYWLIERRHRSSGNPTHRAWLLVVALAYLLLLVALATGSGWWQGDLAVTVMIAIAAMALCGLGARTAITRHETATTGWDDRPDDASLQTMAEARSRLGHLFRSGFVLLLVLLAVGAIDGLGLALYRAMQGADASTAWYGGVIALFTPLVLRLTSVNTMVGRILGPATHPFELPMATLVAVLGFAAWAAVGALVCALSHAITHGFGPIDAGSGVQWRDMALLSIVLFVLVTLFANTWSFINRSSHATLYASRLIRSFLGASNPDRSNDAGAPDRTAAERRGATGRSMITEPVLGDDCNMRDFHDGLIRHGGPLHLINVTVNKTASLNRSVVDRDRKGFGMAVGPCGLSAGIRHHAYFIHRAHVHPPQVEWHAQLAPLPVTGARSMFAHDPDRVPTPSTPAIEVERLTLGQWIAISGAAVATGLGSRTTLGLSLALSFANLRLGYWWDSGREVTMPWLDRLRQVFPVQAHLLDEMLGRFVGAEERHWYLSDGGHFENTGGYELIRRRVGLIVVVDAEEDPAHRCSGFAGLVRKARLDFGAEITVLPRRDFPPDLQSLPDVFGTLDDLRPGPDGGVSRCRAVLARVDYTGERPTTPRWLLYLKPTLDGSEPADLREYSKLHPNFPQQPTSDQMFDESQWESYRKLGECVADAVFAGRRNFDDLLGGRNARNASAGNSGTSSSPDCQVGIP